ncbi:MAG TPA: beta-propeller domain-containing protein [Terricaulis sp.]|nr:beta-propeller domain-containing protein [Terricaulis sp.]
MGGRYLIALAMCAALWGVAPIPEAGAQQSSMPSFRSDADLRRFLTRGGDLDIAVPPPPPPPSPPPPVAAPSPGAAPAPSAPSAPDNPAITSTQIVGVDEGGIVKVSGDYLIVLRRGRLFSISTADSDLRPVHQIDAYPPGVSGRGDWYDEMLISGDLIIVVGYSYRRGGTEINRFRIARDGRFNFVDSHHLRSNDYYSSRNYASRLIGTQLVVYTPLFFSWNADDPLDALPGMSRWEPGQEAPRWRRIATGRQVFLPAPMRRAGPTAVEAMHTVSRCDLAQAELSCTATVVLGPASRTFFVSQNAVYVWVNYTWQRQEQAGYLYRIPLDGSRPGAAQVRGGPIDQFSFHPNAADSTIDVLAASRSAGDEMWAPEFAGGRPALLRLPTSRFGDGSRAPRASDYHWLPGGENSNIGHNRFVNGRLLYSLFSWRDRARSTRLVVAPLDRGPPTIFDMPEGVDRIEQIGQDALVVGSADGAAFTTIDLINDTPALGSRFTQPGARESESRSHAFFYRADSADGADGILGLPILRNVQAADGRNWLTAEDMLFLRRQSRALSDFGRLTATPSGRPDDGCQASCTDWYGNARPIFLRGRVFALMGYELVEGDESGDSIREVRRVNYAPAPAPQE